MWFEGLGLRFIEEYRADFRTPVPLVLWAVLTVLVALAGPFGTYATVPVATRLLQWAVLIGAAILIGAAVRAFVHGIVGLRDFRRGSLLIAVLVTPIFAIPLHFIADTLFGDIGPALPSTIEIGLFVFCVSLGVGAFRHAARGTVLTMGRATPEDPAQQGPAVQPRVMDRIDPEQRGQLIRISGKDHYVELVTCKGRSTVLLRLSDAIAEAGPVAGVQVHRSHWVALDAVAGTERRDGKVFLTLRDGSTIPVSRNYRAEAEALGLI